MTKYLRYLSAFFCLLTLIIGLVSGYLIYTGTIGIKYPNDNHLVLLAQRFIARKISLSPYNLPAGDVVDYFGNLYLYFGPTPSIILSPLVVLWGPSTPQVIIGLSSLATVFICCLYMGRKLKFNKENSLWLAIFFCFSSVFFSVAITNISAFQVQALGTALIFLSLAEYLGKRRWLIIGVLIGLAGLTRITLYGAIVFFIIELLINHIKVKHWIIFFLPIVISFLVFGAYNYRRFHNVLETGYKYNVTLKNYPMSSNLKFGFLSVSHIPANLYVLLLKAPEPIFADGGGFVLKFPYIKADPWGMAIWWTSPLLVSLFWIKRKQYVLSSFIVSGLLIIPSILYSGIGFIQFGYRYSLDFLPFIFLALISGFSGKLQAVHKLLIFLGVLFTGLYMASLWGVYPYFGIK